MSGSGNGGKDGGLYTQPSKRINVNESPSSKATMTSGFGNSATTMTGRLPYPMLTRTNYAAWAMRMKYFLRTNGAWGAVNREGTSSEVVDESKDQLALNIISQAIDDETLLRVAEKETASDVWDALRSMHVGVERVREARIQSLRSEFDNLKMSDAESMDDFSEKFTTLVGRIRELGDAMEEKYVVKKLLRGVSIKFIHVASSIMLFNDINKMTLEEAFGSLKAHEELVKGREVQREEQLLIARGYDSSRGRGRGRGRGEGRKDKSKVQCYNCQDYGHFAWECPKKEKEEEALLAQGYGSNEQTLR
ncbi:hypothetical protein GUJ93_ZPchr0014g46535 [Zizania palustris]|uniref:CCHC-type domain-containing protein n=1 Tax=Zizania palustris TaxID=103762 RepID=A0A8J5W5U0_ZIZPA|nr:hypothetical protein GUJ93_ZPchr0014g46535 [Zizania palustris]